MKVREILEKWETEAHINPEKKGMFDGKTVTQLEHELAALKKAGPHPEESPGFTKMKELEFAIRAKKAKGGKWAGVDADKTEDNKPTEVSEAKEWKVKHTGRNTNKSVAELEKERTKAKKRHDTKAVKQKNFAIRAKTGWGKAK
jgi:hypothetical protein